MMIETKGGGGGTKQQQNATAEWTMRLGSDPPLTARGFTARTTTDTGGTFGSLGTTTKTTNHGGSYLYMSQDAAAAHVVPSSQQTPLPDTLPAQLQPKVIVKKAVDRKTLFAACRALCFGSVLIAVGIAMATIGFYSKEFAMELLRNGTQLLKIENPAVEIQYRSLSYIGPVIMGVGAFLLMIACVMTLESRDKNTQVVHEYPTDLLKSKREPSLRKKRPSRATTKLETESSHLRPEHSPIYAPNSGRNTAQGELIDQVFDLPTGAALNRTFKRDDSRTTRLGSDSSPMGTTTTYATYLTKSLRDSSSKDPGVEGKCSSTSNIDSLSRQADTRALLQRFLEDQSELMASLRTQRKPNRPKLPNSRTDYSVKDGRDRDKALTLRGSLHSNDDDGLPNREDFDLSGSSKRLARVGALQGTGGATSSRQRVVLAEIHYSLSEDNDFSESASKRSLNDYQPLDSEQGSSKISEIPIADSSESTSLPLWSRQLSSAHGDLNDRRAALLHESLTAPLVDLDSIEAFPSPMSLESTEFSIRNRGDTDRESMTSGHHQIDGVPRGTESTPHSAKRYQHRQRQGSITALTISSTTSANSYDTARSTLLPYLSAIDLANDNTNTSMTIYDVNIVDPPSSRGGFAVTHDDIDAMEKNLRGDRLGKNVISWPSRSALWAPSQYHNLSSSSPVPTIKNAASQASLDPSASESEILTEQTQVADISTDDSLAAEAVRITQLSKSARY